MSRCHRGHDTTKLAFLVLFALLVSLATGCWQRHESKQETSAQPQEQTSPFPLTVTDDLERTVVIPKVPEKIVSLAPSNTEILFALGLGAKVVGVDDYSNYPEEAKSLTKIGGFSNPSIEKVSSLGPDLILGTEAHVKFLPQLEELGIPVYLLSPRTLEEVLDSFEAVGNITGASEAGKRLRQEVKMHLDGVRAKYEGTPVEKRPKVYYEVYSDPIMTAGPNTLIHHIIEAAGGVNIASDAKEDYPVISPEIVIERNPDVIVYPKFHGTGVLTVEQLQSRPGWTQISALKSGKVYAIDADIMSRPGPRVVQAVEQLAEFLWGR
ncbi:MAG TPA: cobalamin-binding protein [Clostridia bacterium]|nr:cobalamin-binding protein [Clostridia bacterium]